MCVALLSTSLRGHFIQPTAVTVSQDNKFNNRPVVLWLSATDLLRVSSDTERSVAGRVFCLCYECKEREREIEWKEETKKKK